MAVQVVANRHGERRRWPLRLVCSLYACEMGISPLPAVPYCLETGRARDGCAWFVASSVLPVFLALDVEGPPRESIGSGLYTAGHVHGVCLLAEPALGFEPGEDHRRRGARKCKPLGVRPDSTPSPSSYWFTSARNTKAPVLPGLRSSLTRHPKSHSSSLTRALESVRRDTLASTSMDPQSFLTQTPSATTLPLTQAVSMSVKATSRAECPPIPDHSKAQKRRSRSSKASRRRGLRDMRSPW